jgi:hypothetical protein
VANQDVQAIQQFLIDLSLNKENKHSFNYLKMNKNILVNDAHVIFYD